MGPLFCATVPKAPTHPHTSLCQMLNWNRYYWLNVGELHFLTVRLPSMQLWPGDSWLTLWLIPKIVHKVIPLYVSDHAAFNECENEWVILLTRNFNLATVQMFICHGKKDTEEADVIICPTSQLNGCPLLLNATLLELSPTHGQYLEV